MGEQYESMQALALAHKAMWEGGWATFILDYGLDVEELPPDAPEGMAAALLAFKHGWDSLQSFLSVADEEI